MVFGTECASGTEAYVLCGEIPFPMLTENNDYTFRNILDYWRASVASETLTGVKTKKSGMFIGERA